MISNRMKTLLKALAALSVLTSISLFLSCMKAGDGVGLDNTGARIKPCALDPKAMGCPGFDSCLSLPLDQQPQRCKIPIDSCTLAVKPPRCTTVTVDSCTLAIKPSRCVDSCDGTYMPKPPSCLDKEYFTTKVLPIFVANCKTCHNSSVKESAGFMQTKLSLVPEDAWDSLVNVKSYEVGLTNPKLNMKRVSPGQPDSSYLYWKISMDNPKRGMSTRMPLNSTTGPLSDADILIIKTWILGKN